GRPPQDISALRTLSAAAIRSMSKRARNPALHGLYHQHLVDQDTEAFGRAVGARYTIGTLERLSAVGDRMARRAAVLALGLLADYGANAALGRALHDEDRGVRMLAESGIRQLWCRTGTSAERKRLLKVVALNTAKRFSEAVDLAGRLIEQAPGLAEG